MATRWADDVDIEFDGSASYCILSYHCFLRWQSPRIGAFVRTVLSPFELSDGQGPWVPLEATTPGRYDFVDQGEDAGSNRYQLRFDDRVMVESAEPGYPVEHLLWHAHAEALKRTGDFFLTHAGAVVAPSGKAVLLSAESGGGKTTLTAGLVRAGFGYLSDEAAAIDPVGRLVHPFAKALIFKSGSFQVFPDLAPPDEYGDLSTTRWFVLPTQLRSDAVGLPSPVGHVLLIRYERGSPATIEPMTRAEAVVQLAQNSMNFWRYGRRGLPLLRDVVATARCARLSFGDLDEAVAAVTAICANGPAANSVA